jgi:hypothetical protein
LEPSKVPSVGWGLGVMMWFLKKWLKAQKSDWYSKETAFFLGDTRLLK